MRKLASAIEFMHGRGIVHRDLKPEVLFMFCSSCYFILRLMFNLWTDVNSYLHLTNNSYMTWNETNKQTIDGLKITAKQQLTNHYNFHVLMTNHITTKLTYQNQDQRHKYHHLTTTLHLTLKMTTTQVVEMSVTNNSLSKDYHHPDDHGKQIFVCVS